LISTRISQASAGLLLMGGLGLLFASDVILPRLIPTLPAGGTWLGQLVAAAWLAVAALNWLSQGVLLGGIYGRPVVLANAALYFITATTLVEIVVAGPVPTSLWFLFVPSVLLAGVYCWLLFRGPFERDFVSHAGAQRKAGP
jgi:hypothetical protein